VGSVRVFVVGWARRCGVEGRRGSGKFGERGGDEARRCGAKCGGPYG
jgi:hypothetical protein